MARIQGQDIDPTKIASLSLVEALDRASSVTLVLHDGVKLKYVGRDPAEKAHLHAEFTALRKLHLERIETIAIRGLNIDPQSVRTAQLTELVSRVRLIITLGNGAELWFAGVKPAEQAVLRAEYASLVEKRPDLRKS